MDDATAPAVRVLGFDHLVLRCRDVEASLAWYRDRLGLAGERVDQWRAGEVPFPSVRIDEHTIVDLVAAVAAPATTTATRSGAGNLDHLCLVVAPGVVDAVAGGAGGFTVVDGPAERFGARGVGWSVYVTDPDGTVVELRSYPPT